MQVKTPVQEIMVLRDFINNLSINQSPVGTSPTSKPSALISSDIGNELTVGSDNKLLLETDKLQTSFEYAASVNTFWSI